MQAVLEFLKTTRQNFRGHLQPLQLLEKSNNRNRSSKEHGKMKTVDRAHQACRRLELRVVSAENQPDINTQLLRLTHGYYVPTPPNYKT